MAGKLHLPIRYELVGFCYYGCRSITDNGAHRKLSKFESSYGKPGEEPEIGVAVAVRHE